MPDIIVSVKMSSHNLISKTYMLLHIITPQNKLLLKNNRGRKKGVVSNYPFL